MNIHDETAKHVFSNVKFSSIQSIKFSLYSKEEILKMSACEVTNHMLHKHYIPQDNSVNDLRLGTSDKRLMCSTCVNNVHCCFGHYGHIELAEAVYHPGYIKNIVKVLRCICYYCSRIRLIDTPHCDIATLERLCGKIQYCQHCRSPQPSYTAMGCAIARFFDLNIQFACNDVDLYHQELNKDRSRQADLLLDLRDSITQEREWAEQPFTPKFCRQILMDISNNDARKMGFSNASRPENMILELLIVPPVAIRPYNNTMLTGNSEDRSKGQSDLTQRLIKIIKDNEACRNIERGDGYLYPIKRMELLGKLQNSVMEYIQTIKPVNPKYLSTKLPNEVFPRQENGHIVNEEGLIVYNPIVIKQSDHLRRSFVGFVAAACRSNNPSVTQPLSGRLAGIAGRMRGKDGRLRLNLCGKRVNWSSRSVISPDVTNDINELGVPHHVARGIIISEFVHEFNKSKLTTCIRTGQVTSIQKKDKNINQNNLNDIILEPGDVVERCLMDGDWVLFNRQPTLHKYSIMAFKVKVCEGLSFRLPLPTTCAFGADFDGDEMNMHKLLSPEAEAEMVHIMAVEKNMISATNHAPIIASVMDTTLGIYNMTQRSIFLTKKQVCDLCMHIRYVKNRTEMEIFAHIPPPAIIKPVELWTGKQIVSLLFPEEYFCRRSFRSSNLKTAKDFFIWDESYVVVHHGELLAGSLCKKAIGISGGNIIHNIHNDFGNIEALHFVSDLQRLAMAFLTIVQPFSVGVSDCLIPESAKDKINHFLEETNIYIENVHDQFPGGNISDEAEVVVTNVLRAMLPKCSGIIQHHLVNSPLAQHSNNRFLTMMTAGSKGTVVNVSQIMGCIGQQTNNGKRIGVSNSTSIPCFRPNDSNPLSKGFVSSSFIQGLKPYEFFFHAVGGREGSIDTAVKTSETGYLSRRILKSMESHCVSQTGSVCNARGDIIQLAYAGNNMDTSCMERVQFTCFNMIDRIPYIYDRSRTRHEYYILNELSVETFVLLTEHESEIDQACIQLRNARILRFPQDLTDDLLVPVCCKRILDRIWNTRKAYHISPEWVHESLLELQNLDKDMQKIFPRPFTKIIMGYIRSEAAIFSIRHGKDSIKEYCIDILKHLYRGKISAGEMVGALAATSISEPTTQLTLKTFQFAGCGNHTVTQGIPRLKELIDVCENIKTPSLRIYLKEYGMDKSKVEKVARGLEYHTFSYFVENVEYIAVQTNSMIESCFDIRYQMNIARMIVQNISLEFLIEALYDFFGFGFISVMNADESTDIEWWIKIHFYDIRPILHAGRYAFHLIHLPREYYISEPTQPVYAVTQQVNILREFHIQTISPIHIQGIKDIKRCVITETKYMNIQKQEVTEYIIQTDGSALAEILELEFVDRERTTTNHVVEMFHVLGICAASNLLQQEIINVLMGDGGYVAESHIRLLVNTITSQGLLYGNNRNGIIKHTSSSLARASFEVSVDVLQKAALSGETDPIKGVSETILTGKLCPVGTGTVELLNRDGTICPAGQVIYTKKLLENFMPIHIIKNQSIPNLSKSAHHKAIDMLPWG